MTCRFITKEIKTRINVPLYLLVKESLLTVEAFQLNRQKEWGMNRYINNIASTMRGDCGGAAAVVGILRAISTLQLNVNVIGELCRECRDIQDSAH